MSATESRDNVSVTRHRRIPLALALSVLVPVLLAGCGTVSAHESEHTHEDTHEHTDELLERAEKWNVSPELVFVTEAEGYDLAIQSAGVFGDDAFRSIYVATDRGGRQFALTADHGSLDAKTCAFTPLSGGGSTDGVHCEEDGELWYRTDGTAHEYAKVVGGLLVQVTAQRDAVDRDTLLAAAQHAHVVVAPQGSGSEDPATPTPVERGDLPRHGDGAPLDLPAAGG